MMRMLFAMMDSDGDGTVSLQEFQAAHERIFKAMDANKDGRLTVDEVQAFMRGTGRAAGWADDNFDHAGLDFIGGGNLWVYSDRRPISAAIMSTFGQAPTWGASWKAFIKENADRWNIAYLQKTTLPYEDNVLDLDPVVKDALGFPVIRITADNKDNEKKIGAFIQDKMAQWFMAAGAKTVERGPPGTMGPSTHAYGGTRMGDNRETNAVEQFAHREWVRTPAQNPAANGCRVRRPRPGTVQGCA